MELHQSRAYDWLPRVKGWVEIGTGTVLVCEAPGKEFGKTVEYQGIVFEVPKEYQGVKNVALVLDNSTIKMEQLSDGKILLTAKVSKSHEYPTENGWGIPDTDTGIPTEVTDDHPDPKDCYRYLLRSRGPYIGPIVRVLGIGGARETVNTELSLGDLLWVKEVPKQPQDELRPNVVDVEVKIYMNDGQNGLNKALFRVDAA